MSISSTGTFLNELKENWCPRMLELCFNRPTSSASLKCLHVKLFRPTKEKGRNELQVVKENLGGSEGVGIKKWPTHCRRNCTLCTCIFHFCTFVSRSCPINMKPRLALQFCGQREHVTKKCQFSLSISKTLIPI